MNDLLRKLNKASRDIRLTDAERSGMRAALEHHMNRPVRPMRSPFVFAIFRSRATMGALSVLIVFVLAGSGVSYAAEGALPGDPLYGVKTGVNERVATLMATTPVAKAAVEASLANRRLDEAAELASEGKLSADAQSQIATNFEQHAAAVNDSVAALADAKDDDAAAEASSDFESSLLAHGAILASLAGEGAGENTSATTSTSSSPTTSAPLAQSPRPMMFSATVSTSTSTPMPASTATTSSTSTATSSQNASIESLVASIKDAARTTIESRAAIEAEIRFSKTSQTTALAEARAQAVEKHIAAITKTFNGLKPRLADDNATTISDRLSAAQGMIDSGSASLAAGDPGSAYVAFQNAERVLNEVQILLNDRSLIEKKSVPVSGVLDTTITASSTEKGAASSSTSSTTAIDRGPSTTTSRKNRQRDHIEAPAPSIFTATITPTETSSQGSSNDDRDHGGSDASSGGDKGDSDGGKDKGGLDIQFSF